MRCDLCGHKLSCIGEFTKCERCELVSKKKIEKYDGTTSTWGRDYVTEYEQGISWRSLIAKRRMSLIGSIVQEKIIHLDVGGATGLLSSLLLEAGHSSDNFEPDESFFAKSMLRGISTIRSISALPDEKYNVITSFDSLGYSTNLVEDLSSLGKKTKENFVFFGSFGFTEYGIDNCPDLSFNYYFNTKALEYLFNFFPKGKWLTWVESRSYNKTEFECIPHYWETKLFLTEEPKVRYFILLGGKYSKKITGANNYFWEESKK